MEPVLKHFIVFRGRLKSGKSTAAKYYEQKFDNVKRLAFADALKEEVYDLLWRSNGLRTPNSADDEQVIREYFAYVPGFKGYGISPADNFVDLYYVSSETKREFIDSNKDDLRPLLQWYGTEYRRSQDENYWVTRFMERAERHINNGFLVVVDDCRFPNELAALKARGCVDIWVDNPELGPPEGIIGHASEQMTEGESNITFTNRPSQGLDFFYETLDVLASVFEVV